MFMTVMQKIGVHLMSLESSAPSAMKLLLFLSYPIVTFTFSNIQQSWNRPLSTQNPHYGIACVKSERYKR